MIKQFPHADIVKGKMVIDHTQGFKPRRKKGDVGYKCTRRNGGHQTQEKPSSMSMGLSRQRGQGLAWYCKTIMAKLSSVPARPSQLAAMQQRQS
jgi:hypothetical protein